MHGARSGNGSLVHGRRSPLIVAFGRRIDDLAKAEDLLEFNTELASFDEYLCRLAERAKDRDSPLWRRGLQAQAIAFDSAVHSNNVEKLKKAINNIWPDLFKDIIEGAEEDLVWASLLDNRERRAAVATAAVSARAKQETVVTARELVAALGRMADIVAQVAGPKQALECKRLFERDILQAGVDPPRVGESLEPHNPGAAVN